MSDSGSSKTDSSKSALGPKRTPLYQSHVDAGGKLVDFSGWEMPVNYGSQIEEHHNCRTAAVVFDVSHMTVLDFERQPEASSDQTVKQFLQHLLANNVDRLKASGAALYTCMLNEQGGIIDDLIVYWRGEDDYRLVVNAGTREKDLAWIESQLPVGITMTEREDLALLAVQGPQAIERLAGLYPDFDIAGIKRFHSLTQGSLFIARTGYTGEDGFEIGLPAADAPALWKRLLEAGVLPAGLGARDTLRLEAAMNLYGNDMDESVTPLESGISWTVAWEPSTRNFIGRSALQAMKESGGSRQLVGLVLKGRGVLRSGQEVMVDGKKVGEVTSGTYSPTLEQSIALARVTGELKVDWDSAETTNSSRQCQVKIRDKFIEAVFVKPPFVKNGKSTI